MEPSGASSRLGGAAGWRSLRLRASLSRRPPPTPTNPSAPITLAWLLYHYLRMLIFAESRGVLETKI